MKQILPLDYKSRRIMTTKILAEAYGTKEDNIQKNFSRNEDRFEEGKHYFKLEGQELKNFKDSLPTESLEPLKFAPVLYLWTERGAARHAKILDTDEAWNVYEELEDNYFNPKQSTLPVGASKELQAIFMLDGKQQQFESRLVKVENNMTIDYSQQESLRELGNKKVTAILGGTDAPAYKELGKKVFASFWRDYKRKLGVNSYKNTLVKDYEIGRQAIINWQPTKEVAFMIKGCNAQVRCDI